MSGQVEDNLSPLAANLIAEMERTGMTIAQVAQALEVGERQITRWRSGQEPRYKFVRRMGVLFGRTPEWFVTNHDSDQVAA